MFGENLKMQRKAKGLSQEELAQRLHIVRQTISKWEKGLSVPDAEMLIRIAELFEIQVSELLGSVIETPESKDAIAPKLEQLNMLLAERNRRDRIIWRVAAGILICFAVGTALCIILSVPAAVSYKTSQVEYVTLVEEVNNNTAQDVEFPSPLEKRLGEAVAQMEKIKSAVVSVDDTNNEVVVEIETSAGSQLTEKEILSVKNLIENALDDPSECVIEVRD